MRYFSIGDIVKLTTKSNISYIGRIRHLINVYENKDQHGAYILLSQHPLHNGADYGDFATTNDNIKKIELLYDYSGFKDTSQDNSELGFRDETLNVSKIRQLMSDFEFTSADLAYKINKDRSMVAKILNRKQKDVTLSTALLIAEALDVSLDEIVNKPKNEIKMLEKELTNIE